MFAATPFLSFFNTQAFYDLLKVHTMVRPEFVFPCVEALGSALERNLGTMIMGGECSSVQACYYSFQYNLLSWLFKFPRHLMVLGFQQRFIRHFPQRCPGLPSSHIHTALIPLLHAPNSAHFLWKCPIGMSHRRTQLHGFLTLSRLPNHCASASESSSRPGGRWGKLYIIAGMGEAPRATWGTG